MTVFAIALGIVYLIVGAAKLAGAKPMAEQFDEFGLGNAGMRTVGLLEVAAAVGLQFEPLAPWAATGMVAMMVGAIYHHRRVDHPTTSFLPAVVVLVASALFTLLSI